MSLIEDSDLYRQMADAYDQACCRQPFMNHSVLAMMVGARAMNIPVNSLQSRSMKHDLVEARQRLMAFSRVVSVSTTCKPNSWKGIGRAFKRHHATVIHSVAKYGEEITAALGVRP